VEVSGINGSLSGQEVNGVHVEVKVLPRSSVAVLAGGNHASGTFSGAGATTVRAP
jgi:hypothetical protein